MHCIWQRLARVWLDDQAWDVGRIPKRKPTTGARSEPPSRGPRCKELRAMDPLMPGHVPTLWLLAVGRASECPSTSVVDTGVLIATWVSGYISHSRLRGVKQQ